MSYFDKLCMIIYYGLIIWGGAVLSYIVYRVAEQVLEERRKLILEEKNRKSWETDMKKYQDIENGICEAQNK